MTYCMSHRHQSLFISSRELKSCAPLCDTHALFSFMPRCEKSAVNNEQVAPGRRNICIAKCGRRVRSFFLLFAYTPRVRMWGGKNKRWAAQN